MLARLRPGVGGTQGGMGHRARNQGSRPLLRVQALGLVGAGGAQGFISFPGRGPLVL